MERPTFFGWFHCIFFFFTIVTLLLFIVFSKRLKDKQVRIIIFILWFVMVIMESLKQIFFANPIIDGVVTFHYDYGAIPYQICGLPLLFLPLVVFLKDSKFRDIVINFCATFLFFAGMAVIFYPGDCFYNYVLLNCCSMIHHSSQAIACGLIAIYYYNKLSIKKVTISSILMVASVLLAVLFNEVAHKCEVSTNYFMISQYCHTDNPIINSIFNSAPYWYIIIVFVVWFFLLAIMTLSIEKLIHRVDFEIRKIKA